MNAIIQCTGTDVIQRYVRFRFPWPEVAYRCAEVQVTLFLLNVSVGSLQAGRSCASRRKTISFFKLIPDTQVKRVGTCAVVAGEMDANRL